MDRLRSIEAFVRVADSRSFAEAARQLGISKSVVTTRVQQLEALVRAPLFHRTTRAVRLSETGAAFYAECADLVTKSDRLVDRMRELRGTPAGKLRVHALPGFALGYFGRVLHRFQEAYPRIQLELVVSDALVDPVRDGFDCTLQIFAPVSDSLVAKRLFEWRPVFCASPAYLEANGEPARPADLTGHRLGLYSRYPTRDRWSFTSRTQNRTTTLDLKPFLRTNSVHLLRDYACADAGIVCVPTLVASDALLSGQLRALLRGYRLPTFALSAVYPSSHAGRSRLKLFLECLSAAHDDGPAPWDGALVEAGLIGA